MVWRIPDLDRINENMRKSKQNISLKDKNIICRKCRTTTIEGERCWLCGYYNEVRK